MISVEPNRSVYRLVRFICCKMTKFIVVAIINNAVSWTIVNNIMMMRMSK